MYYKSLALIILISLIIPQVSFGFCYEPPGSLEYQMCKQNELQEKQIKLQEQAILQQQRMQQQQLDQQRSFYRNLENERLNQKIRQMQFLY